jgi:hypothetical protein
MTLKELIQNTTDTFKWDVIEENVYDDKKGEFIKNYPVYGVFYKDFYCGYWYKRKFYMFESLDGTDEDVWLDSDDQTIYTNIKQVLKAIPELKLTIKEAEIYLKKIEIEKDFKEE